MKKIIIMLLTIFSLSINAQPFEFQCIMNTNNTDDAPSLVGGLYKPESVTKYTSDPNAYFPVLIVYVQFKNDPGPDRVVASGY